MSRTLGASLVGVLLLGLGAAPALGRDAHTTSASALAAYRGLPLTFVPNAGQTDRRVRFLARAGGVALFFTTRSVTLAGPKRVIRVRFAGARPRVTLRAAVRAPGRVNYLFRTRPSITGLPAFERLTYHGLWRGVDLVLSGRGGRLDSTLSVSRDADTHAIRLAKSALRRLSAALAGPGRAASSRSAAGGLVYSTLLGGTSDDEGADVAVDDRGSAYVVGYTDSLDFPVTPGAIDQPIFGERPEAGFVTKLRADGSALVYSSYLGDEYLNGVAVNHSGNAFVLAESCASRDCRNGAFVQKLNRTGSKILFSAGPGHGNSIFGSAIAIDGEGSAYFTGYAAAAENDEGSLDTTAGAFSTTFNGGNFDGFAVKVGPSGAVVYSTFLGGEGNDFGGDIAVDAAGDAYVVGTTGEPDDPTHPPVPPFGGGGGFVVKLNPAGSALQYGTPIVGAGLSGVALGDDGSAYLTGSTDSPDFPTTPGAADRTLNGMGDVVVAKLDPAGSAFVYATLLGGSGRDDPGRIAVDARGNAYVTGTTRSADFPVTLDAFDQTLDGTTDMFVTRVNPRGSQFVYSTLLGGEAGETAGGIVLGPQGDVYVSGSTSSAEFPTTPGAFDRTFNGGAEDAYVTRLAIGTPTGACSRVGVMHGSGIIEGTRGDDVICGSAGPDQIDGRGGNDVIYGLGGDDIIHGGNGHDELHGGAGADTLSGGGNRDTVSYADRTEPLLLSIGDGPNDGASGEGDDIQGDVENVTGGSGDDVITGDGGRNELIGGPGNDQITGGLGVDRMFGRSGDDTLTSSGDGASDANDCGAGTDTAHADPADTSTRCETVTALTPNTRNARVHGRFKEYRYGDSNPGFRRERAAS